MMASSASRADEGAPTVPRPGRRAAGFPTATIDLRRPVAGVDNSLAWMSRRWGLRRLSGPFARWGRRIVLHLHTLQNQPFSLPGGESYEMLQLWMSNGGSEDIEAVQCQTRWTSDSALVNIKTDEGLWLRLNPFERVQHLGEVMYEVDFPAVSGAKREGMQYLGLAVKYRDDEHAYLVTADSYRGFGYGGQTWRHPGAALTPGRHFVDIALRAADNRAALIRLQILNLGCGGPLRAEVVAGQLLA